MALSKLGSGQRDHLIAIQTKGDPSAVANIDEFVAGIREVIRGNTLEAGHAVSDALAERSSFVDRAKIDAGQLGLDMTLETHIPEAQSELDAIVAATESATSEIMGAAEQIESLAETLDEAVLAEVIDHVMTIYQACGFQDITGQRVSKVSDALVKTGASVDLTLAVLGDDAAQQRVEQHLAQCTLNTEKLGEEIDLLDGPQLQGGGNSQDDIDKLLESFD